MGGFSCGLSSEELFAFSREMKLQNWRQVLNIVTLCCWYPFCIRISEKQMRKKCRSYGYGKFSSALNACGCKVFSVIIQKSSRFFHLHFSSSLSVIYVIVWITPPGWWGEGERRLTHFSERLYRRDKSQIRFLGGNWHCRWGWLFSGRSWKLLV